MDAAQKLLKTSALVFVVALLMAVPGWAQPQLLTSSSVTIGSTGSNDAGVTSTGDPITYTIGTPNYSVDTTGSRTGWLSVTGGTTTPASLHFAIGTTSGGNPGAAATVTLTPTAPAGVTPVTITVTFNGSGGGGGGGSNVLTPSQTSVTLPGNGSVVLSTTSVSAISLTVSVSQSSCGNVNWLDYQLPVTDRQFRREHYAHGSRLTRTVLHPDRSVRVPSRLLPAPVHR